MMYVQHHSQNAVLFVAMSDIIKVSYVQKMAKMHPTPGSGNKVNLPIICLMKYTIMV